MELQGYFYSMQISLIGRLNIEYKNYITWNVYQSVIQSINNMMLASTCEFFYSKNCVMIDRTDQFETFDINIF